MTKFCFLLSLMCFAANLAQAEAPPTHTYYVDIQGNEALKAKIVQKLSAKPCFKISDISKTKTSTATSTDCYAFLPATKNTKLHGKNEFLFKVKLQDALNANQPRTVNVQGYQKLGAQTVRYFNPGTFHLPSQHQINEGKADYSEKSFVQASSDLIIGLSFK